MTIELIDKYDNFEIVGFQIASILANETLNQQQLAIDGGKNPDLWKFDIYSERFCPWENFLDNPDGFPIVNVAWDNSNFESSSSDVISRQASIATYNIDIYASSPSIDQLIGYKKGDEESTLVLHRIIRLVRNILMHPDNTYLQLFEIINNKQKHLVWYRWIDSIIKFQPQIGDRPIQNVIAARIIFNVKFNELAISQTFELLESVYTTAKRAEDGKIIFEADFQTI